MYQAEIRGKLPGKFEGSEDVLTSNVFSFFKYSNRSVFLKRFLMTLGIKCSNMELARAEFLFWPNYDDGTQPDLVILVGDYYLLCEAKYFSGFGYDSDSDQWQLDREYVAGSKEARTLGKKFYIVVITGDYNYPEEIFRCLNEHVRNCIKWLNWQDIAGNLLRFIESGEVADWTQYVFAVDLYDLLEKKHLRAFRSFHELGHVNITNCDANVFYSAEDSIYRGKYFGFVSVLSKIPELVRVESDIFIQKKYFYFELDKIINDCVTIFYWEQKND